MTAGWLHNSSIVCTVLCLECKHGEARALLRPAVSSHNTILIAHDVRTTILSVSAYSIVLLNFFFSARARFNTPSQTWGEMVPDYCRRRVASVVSLTLTDSWLLSM